MTTSIPPNNLVLIGEYHVDVDALLSLEGYCEPPLCKDGPCCCASYQIGLTDEEADRATALMEAACQYQPLLEEEGELVNPFEEDDEGEALVIDSREDGACVFAWRNEQGEMLCSLHTVALDQGLDPFAWKPRSCTLWPLAISDGSMKILGLQEDIDKFACIRRRTHAPRELAPAMVELVRIAMGDAFLAELERVVAHRLALG